MNLTTHPLSAAVRVALCAADPQDVDGASVAAVEASVVEAVRVDPAYERLRSAQRELHPVFAAHLVNYTEQSSNGRIAKFCIRF